MKRFIFICLLVFGSVFMVSASDVLLSFGPWTFITDDESIADGLYPYGGLSIGLSERLEAELFVVAEATPEPFGSVFFGGGLRGLIVGDRAETYLNMFVDLDFLYGLDFSTESLVHNRCLSLRISPLVVGTPYTGTRDRMFTVGALWNFDSGELSMVWNVLIFDIFLNKTPTI